MIIDRLDHAELYYGVSRKLDLAFRFLKENGPDTLAPGRYEIDGADVYALVQSYRTKPGKEGVWEAHRRYADIQYVVSGAEVMGYACADGMKVAREYSEKEDCLLFEGEGSFLTVRPGDFVLFMPQDAHMPGLEAGGSWPVKKVVVKVRVA